MWGNCSGSVPAQASRPSFDSQETREGTAAHWVGSEVLFARQALVLGMPSRGPAQCAEFLGLVAPYGVVVDAKMVEGAEVYVEDVSSVCSRFNAWHLLLIECRVHMPRIHPDNWGTFDSSLWLPDRGLLFLWDYKHGHRQAPAAENLQLIDYTEGLCQRHGIDGLVQQQARLVARIVQPFCYSAGGAIDEWVTPLADLRTYWNRLSVKAHEAMTAPTLTSGKWCRDCTAVGDCVAAKRMGYTMMAVVEEPYAMDAMPPAALALEREQLDVAMVVAKARLEAIEDVLFHQIQDGGTGSGLTIQSDPGSLAWTIPPEQAVALASQFGVNASKPGAITPTQAIAAADVNVRPAFKELLKQFTRRPPGAAKLVPLKDSRTARAFANTNPSQEY